MAVPTAALCPLGEKATAVGEEETARDRLDLQKKYQEKVEMRDRGRMCTSLPEVPSHCDSGLFFML